MKKILEQISKIKKDVKRYVINRWLFQCSLKHAIAFFEWRMFYSPKRKQNIYSKDSEYELDNILKNMFER